jgi:Zn-finger nucleic acid-binding protein
MFCPNENAEMRPVKVESHYGQTVLLDQCPQCGGLWFDKMELYSPKAGEGEKIESINIDLLQSPSTIAGADLVCPLDHTKLVQFYDPYFPKDILIERCPLCEGFWLNRGEFTKYQNYRKKLQQPKYIYIDDPTSVPDSNAILVERPGPGKSDTLLNLGRFLSTPMDPMTGRPQDPSRLSDKEQDSINMILGLLVTVLRFFIRI